MVAGEHVGVVEDGTHLRETARMFDVPVETEETSHWLCSC